MKKTLLITNISHATIKLANGNVLRLHVGAISLENQLSDFGGKGHPMIVGWNENPAVRFADFQLWLKCKVEESVFINTHGQKFPLKEKMFVPNSAATSEFTTSLEFKDGTKIDFTTRDSKRPIEVSIFKDLQLAIKKYGYTEFSYD